jgi:hypothetical protein
MKKTITVPISKVFIPETPVFRRFLVSEVTPSLPTGLRSKNIGIESYKVIGFDSSEDALIFELNLYFSDEPIHTPEFTEEPNVNTLSVSRSVLSELNKVNDIFDIEVQTSNVEIKAAPEIKKRDSLAEYKKLKSTLNKEN